MILKEQDKFFISGSQYFIDRRLSLLTKNMEDAEEHVYYADEFAPDEFVNTAFTPSLFHEYKLLILHRAEVLKKAEFIKEFARPTKAVIVITSVDTKKTADLQKTLRGMGFELVLEGAAKKSPKEVEDIFAESGLKINSACAGQVGLVLNWDMALISREAEKLSLYYAGKENVNPQDILNRIDDVLQDKLFDFIDMFMERQTDKCLKIFAQLSDREEASSRIFYMLTLYLAGLYFKLKVPALYNAKNPLFKGRDYFMRVVDATCRKWKADDVYDMIEKMAQMDLNIKTGRISGENALLNLLSVLACTGVRL